MNDTKYNGWTNYQTWVVNLWMDNEQGSQEFWQEAAHECLQDAIDNDETDVKASAAYALSKRMEDQHDEFMPETTGVYSDLLTNALGMVDWQEIAEHYIGDIDVYSAGWNMPGYMPDNTPAMFLDADDALEHVKEAMRDGLDEESEEDATLIDSWKADSNGEFGQTFNGMHYFVTKL